MTVVDIESMTLIQDMFNDSQKQPPNEGRVLDQLFDYVNDAMYRNDINNLNLLLGINTKYLDTIYISGIIRATFVFRERLSAWPIALEQAKKVLKIRGDNVKDILQGLV